jgi:transcriptional regulator with XRE-family HTH domain
MAQNPPNPVDKHVGNRLRMRRMMLDLSQSKLGEALGLTFQQVQKYEKGTNRLSASKLQQSANFLQVPVTFFFEGLPSNSDAHRANDAPPLTDISDFLTTSTGLALVKAFMRVRRKTLRHSIVRLVEELADQQDRQERQ